MSVSLSWSSRWAPLWFATLALSVGLVTGTLRADAPKSAAPASAAPASAAPAAAPAPAAPTFKSPLAKLDPQDGQTVVFLGDSITHQCMYTQYVEDYFYTRFPERRIKFHNAGVGGDRAHDALVRYERDVASYKPDYVTILLGMNDGSYRHFDRPVFDTYERDMGTLLDKLGELGAKTVVMGPTMFDARAVFLRKPATVATDKEKYYNSVLAFYGAWCKQTAEERGLGFVDMYGPLNALTLEQRKLDPKFTMIADAVHPDAPGQFVMAFALLSDMDVDKQVSSIDIVRRGEKWVGNGQRGKVTDLEVTDEKVSFAFAAEALPWVVPPEAALGVKLTKAGHKLGVERLRIAGLKAGEWELRIDGQLVGAYTNLVLGAKIELQENEKTPQYQQALAVAMLNKERNDKAVRPLRNAWGGMKGKGRSLAAAAAKFKADGTEAEKAAAEKAKADHEAYKAEFDKKIAQLQADAKGYEDKIYAANKPLPRKYELTWTAAKPPAKKDPQPFKGVVPAPAPAPAAKGDVGLPGQAGQVGALADDKSDKSGKAAPAAKESPVLRHVVMFKFKSEVSKDKVVQVERAFAELPGKIKEIKAFEWGVNDSPLQLNEGLTHCFLVTFADAAGRAAYLPHEDHKAFGKLVGPTLDKVFVIDFDSAAPANDAAALGKLRHVVNFRFKKDADPAVIKKIEAEFLALRAKIDLIQGLEWGVNNSPEPHADGFTHCYLLTFADQAALKGYLDHPAHQEFVKLLNTALDKPLVADYVAKK